jgi:hypothetical protein
MKNEELELHSAEDDSEVNQQQHSSEAGQVEFDNYFGSNARLNFFDRYKWLANQTKIAGNEFVDEQKELVEVTLDDGCSANKVDRHLPRLQIKKLSPKLSQSLLPPLSVDGYLSSPTGVILSPLETENQIKPPRTNSRSTTPSDSLFSSSNTLSIHLSPLPVVASRSFLPNQDSNKKKKIYKYTTNSSPSGSRSTSPCPSRASSPLPVESGSSHSSHKQHCSPSQRLPELQIRKKQHGVRSSYSPRGANNKEAQHLVEIDDDCNDNCSIDSHGNLSYNSYHSRASRDSHHSHCFSHRNGRELTPLNVGQIIGEDESIASLTEGKKSPRTRFLLSCIQENINPRPSLLLRNNFSKELDLHHKGMSNEFAKSLSKSLKELPSIESLNLADNRLTDEGLTPLLLQLSNLSSLGELNLSQNKIGKNSANALYEYLSSANCSLSSLILTQADIDDYECTRLIHSLFLNDGSLIDLDLSKNEIGKRETYLSAHHNHHNHQHHHKDKERNTPHFACTDVTQEHYQRSRHPQDSHHHKIYRNEDNFNSDEFKNGSYALGSFLASLDCKLLRLNLQWNMIRLDGGISLCQSLALNNSLIFLDLSYNSLGSQGGIAIGSSLLKNCCLETLNLSYNSIDAIGCITIIAGIVENRTLKKLILDGNPIGDQV